MKWACEFEHAGQKKVDGHVRTRSSSWNIEALYQLGMARHRHTIRQALDHFRATRA